MKSSVENMISSQTQSIIPLETWSLTPCTYRGRHYMPSSNWPHLSPHTACIKCACWTLDFNINDRWCNFDNAVLISMALESRQSEDWRKMRNMGTWRSRMERRDPLPNHRYWIPVEESSHVNVTSVAEYQLIYAFCLDNRVASCIDTVAIPFLTLWFCHCSSVNCFLLFKYGLLVVFQKIDELSTRTGSSSSRYEEPTRMMIAKWRKCRGVHDQLLEVECGLFVQGCWRVAEDVQGWRYSEASSPPVGHKD